MDFGNTPATKLTERVMVEIRDHIKDDAPGTATHYNAVYECVHRSVLAYGLVSRQDRPQDKKGGA